MVWRDTIRALGAPPALTIHAWLPLVSPMAHGLMSATRSVSPCLSDATAGPRPACLGFSHGWDLTCHLPLTWQHTPALSFDTRPALTTWLPGCTRARQAAPLLCPGGTNLPSLEETQYLFIHGISESLETGSKITHICVCVAESWAPIPQSGRNLAQVGASRQGCARDTLLCPASASVAASSTSCCLTNKNLVKCRHSGPAGHSTSVWDPLSSSTALSFAPARGLARHGASCHRSLACRTTTARPPFTAPAYRKLTAAPKFSQSHAVGSFKTILEPHCVLTFEKYILFQNTEHFCSNLEFTLTGPS